jgi:hypothetical protein
MKKGMRIKKEETWILLPIADIYAGENARKVYEMLVEARVLRGNTWVGKVNWCNSN